MKGYIGHLLTVYGKSLTRLQLVMLLSDKRTLHRMTNPYGRRFIGVPIGRRGWSQHLYAQLTAVMPVQPLFPKQISDTVINTWRDGVVDPSRTVWISFGGNVHTPKERGEGHRNKHLRSKKIRVAMAHSQWGTRRCASRKATADLRPIQSKKLQGCGFWVWQRQFDGAYQGSAFLQSSACRQKRGCSRKINIFVKNLAIILTSTQKYVTMLLATNRKEI